MFNSSVLWQVVPSPTLYVSVSMSLPIDPHFALLLAHELFLKKNLCFFKFGVGNNFFDLLNVHMEV